RWPPSSPLFSYTTLFRSEGGGVRHGLQGGGGQGEDARVGVDDDRRVSPLGDDHGGGRQVLQPVDVELLGGHPVDVRLGGQGVVFGGLPGGVPPGGGGADVPGQGQRSNGLRGVADRC